MKLALITDIHEDVVSLKEALRKIEKCKVDEIVCLGDISGFSVPHYLHQETRNAHECLSLIRENCKTIVLGNHDIFAASIIPKDGVYFDFPSDWYQLDYHRRKELAGDKIWLHEEDELNPLYTIDDLEYLRSLPEYAILNGSGQSILFSHYVYPNLSGLAKGFYSDAYELNQHFRLMNSKNCGLSITGHTHVNGIISITPKNITRHGFKKVPQKENPVCFGLPAIANPHKRGGFTIFDTNEQSIRAIKI